MVIYEAARAIVNLTNVSARELAPAVSVLQLFLSSPKPTLRFAAVRTLNKVCKSARVDNLTGLFFGPVFCTFFLWRVLAVFAVSPP